MLTLNRKPGLSVFIGLEIEVKYLKRFHNRVLLEITTAAAQYQRNISINETQVIEPGVSICLTRINGIQIRLNIKAPKHLPIHRNEVREKIEAEARTLSIFEVINEDGSITSNVAATTEEQALAHFKEQQNQHNGAECTAVQWTPDLLKFFEAGFLGDTHVFEELRIACIQGQKPPFTFSLSRAQEAA